MPRAQRLFVPGAIYHVYCRVARGECVFAAGGFAEEWRDALAHVADLHELKVLAYCLMSNHYHVVLETGGIPLWRAMARFQGRVARIHNRQRGLKGRLWQSRYRARIVTGQPYLDHLFAYVHLNPVAAGLVEDPAAHRYSGHRALLGLEPPGLVAVRAALAVFDPDPDTARRAYLRHLRTVAEARWLTHRVRDLPWWRSVSDDEQTTTTSPAPPAALSYRGQPLPPEIDLRPRLATVAAWFESPELLT